MQFYFILEFVFCKYKVGFVFVFSGYFFFVSLFILSLFTQNSSLILLFCLVYIILGFIISSNYGAFSQLLAFLLSAFSLLFFFCPSFLVLFFCMEIVSLIILFYLYFWGYQVEKISSGWFLIFFSGFTGLIYLFLILFFGMSNLIFLTNFADFLGLLLILAFLMKLPMFLVHLWLPKVHVESPTISSVLLASILLKLGCWGIIIFFLYSGHSLLFFLCFLGVTSLNLVCCFQGDGKSLIAFSSIIHMAMFYLIFLTFSNLGLFSSILIMIGHGIVSGFLFMFVGFMYKACLSREIFYHSGIFKSNLFTGFFIFLIFLMNAGLPPFINFISEIYGLEILFCTNSFFLVFLTFYFMFSFLYSLNYALNCFLGISSTSFYVMSYNIFIFFSMFCGIFFII